MYLPRQRIAYAKIPLWPRVSWGVVVATFTERTGITWRRTRMPAGPRHAPDDPCLVHQQQQEEETLLPVHQPVLRLRPMMMHGRTLNAHGALFRAAHKHKHVSMVESQPFQQQPGREKRLHFFWGEGGRREGGGRRGRSTLAPLYVCPYIYDDVCTNIAVCFSNRSLQEERNTQYIQQ